MSSSTTWRFFGGIRTIGGTIITIENDNHRLIFDLGRKFEPSAPVFDGRIRERGPEDLIRLGVAPGISGLYADALPAKEEVDRNTMAFISHSHLDHTGLLPFINPELPILLSKNTHKLLQSLDAVGMGPGKHLNYRPAEFDSPVSFGPFRLTLLEVDHDTPGACGLLIEAPDIRFIYTGDLRLHGNHPEKTHSFAQRGREFNPDVLFIEGTRVAAENNDGILAETELKGAYIKTLENLGAGVFFNYYPHNVERLASLKDAAMQSGRQLVTRASSLYIAAQMGRDIKGIAVAGSDRDEWTEQCSEWVHSQQIPVVELSALQSKPEDFMLELPYHRLTELVDLEPAKGSMFIHSNGDPLGPFDPAWDNLQFWLNTFGIGFSSIGTPGHASRGDILSLVNTISPWVLMPIHSPNPERIGLHTIPRIMPMYDYTYSKEDLEGAKPPTPDELEIHSA